MTLDGTFTKKYKLPGEFPSPDALIAGPDGALWIGQGNIGQVSRLDVGLDPPVTAEGTTFSAKAGVAPTHTVATFTDADPNARARDYDVTINWGDGSKSDGSRAPRRRRLVQGPRPPHLRQARAPARSSSGITDGVGKGIDAKVDSSASSPADPRPPRRYGAPVLLVLRAVPVGQRRLLVHLHERRRSSTHTTAA